MWGRAAFLLFVLLVGFVVTSVVMFPLQLSTQNQLPIEIPIQIEPEETPTQIQKPNPIVSVVTGFCHRLEALRDCVSSVQNQTLTNWEMVLVLDDATHLRTCVSFDFLKKEFQHDPRLRIIKASECKGRCVHGYTAPGFVRNVGIAQARGEFIALIDDDDCMMPDRLEKQVALLRAHPHAGMAASNAYVNNINQNQNKHFVERKNKHWTCTHESMSTSKEWHEWFVYPPGISFPTYKQGDDNTIICSSVMFRRELFHSLNLTFDPRGYEWFPKVYEDWELWLEFFEKGLILVRENKPLIAYDWHHGKR
jgi:glycosyltransferase involved in cell wall biosynthesis